MLWNIDTSEWGALWSGLLGSIPASILAALVAVYVLNRSNSQQRELAAGAVEAQRQRDELLRNDQREALERQIQEQRNEATKQREYAAIADLVAAADSALHLRDPGLVEDNLLKMQTAWVRWRFEVNHEPLREEMVMWPYLVSGLAMQHLSETTNGSHERLLDTVSVLRHTAMGWPSMSKEQRDEAVKAMSDIRKDYDSERTWT